MELITYCIFTEVFSFCTHVMGQGHDFTGKAVCLVLGLNIETKLLCFLEVEFSRLSLSEKQSVKWVEVLKNLSSLRAHHPHFWWRNNNAVTLEAVVEHSSKLASI